MNYKLVKMNSENKEEITDFIGNECFKMYLEDNPRQKSIYDDKKQLDLSYKNFDILKDGISDDSVVYAAYLDNEIIGAGFIRKDGYLEYLFVEEQYQNQGIGSSLLKKLITIYGENKVINVDARINAVSLYKRFSFERLDNYKYLFVPMERNGSHAK